MWYNGVNQNSGVKTLFDEVLKSVKQWFYIILEKYSDKLKFEIISDTSDNLLANIDSEIYVSELNVSKTDFSPYRYVKLYILDTRKDVNQPPTFVYYDKENDSISDIIDNLNKGINYMLLER